MAVLVDGGWITGAASLDVINLIFRGEIGKW